MITRRSFRWTLASSASARGAHSASRPRSRVRRNVPPGTIEGHSMDQTAIHKALSVDRNGATKAIDIRDKGGRPEHEPERLVVLRFAIPEVHRFETRQRKTGADHASRRHHDLGVGRSRGSNVHRLQRNLLDQTIDGAQPPEGNPRMGSNSPRIGLTPRVDHRIRVAGCEPRRGDASRRNPAISSKLMPASWRGPRKPA